MAVLVDEREQRQGVQYGLAQHRRCNCWLGVVVQDGGSQGALREPVRAVGIVEKRRVIGRQVQIEPRQRPVQDELLEPLCHDLHHHRRISRVATPRYILGPAAKRIGLTVAHRHVCERRKLRPNVLDDLDVSRSDVLRGGHLVAGRLDHRSLVVPRDEIEFQRTSCPPLLRRVDALEQGVEERGRAESAATGVGAAHLQQWRHRNDRVR
mmetsp:Transcript_27784/g.81312  ORF Transcript_27784/g.81312 Transcript_27784/m.81312 type:complete len:209 (-) Transcript_27784:628-1254(-)